MKEDKKIIEYLNNELINPRLSIDFNKYSDEELKEVICKQLFLKKYRKYKIDDKVIEQTKEQINYIIDNKLPFIFTPAFGGYKHHWTKSYPYTDWAEIFNLSFLLEYLKPIIEYYRYGVTIEYESEEIIIERINNMPQGDINKYTNCWYKILDYYNSILPENVKIKYTLAKETYSKDTLYKEMDKRYNNFLEIFDSYDKEDQQYILSKASTNIMWNGKLNLENLSEKERTDFIKESRILDEVFLDADFELRHDFFFQDNRILLCFSFGLWPEGAEAIHIGSCASSMVDFWAGIGILEIREDRIIPRIISKSQFDKIEKDLVRVMVNNKQLNQINSNYDYIYIYNGKLDF